MDENTTQQALDQQQQEEHQQQEEIQNEDKGCQEFLDKMEKKNVATR